MVVQGADKVSLRAVARAANYSPAGLYEYFANKDTLLAALAARSSARLQGILLDALRAAQEEDGDPLVEVGMAYIRFARERQEDFLLLFRRLPSQRRSHADPVSEASPFAVLLQAIEQSFAQGELQGREDLGRDALAYAIWSLCHGASMLQISHLAEYQADFEAADRANLQALIRGFAQTTWADLG